MPTVGLILSVSLILYAIRTEFRRKSNVSYALWISLIWMLYSAAKPVSVWFVGVPSSRLESDYMEGSPIDRNILSVIIVFSLYILLFKRKIKWQPIFKRNLFFVVWILYCGVSILWSDFPTISFKRWIKEIGLFLGVLLVLTESDPIEAAKTLIRRFSYIVIPGSILLILWFPKVGVSYSPDSGAISYVGVALDKNGLGRICLVSGLFFLWSLVTTRGREKLENDKKESLIQVVFFIAILCLLAISNSVTSLSVLIMGTIILAALRLKVIHRNMRYLGIAIILCLTTLFAVQWSFDIMSMFLRFQDRDITFTGRTILWNDLLAFRTNPLIGVGYGSFWLGERLTILWEKHAWLPNESHNGYLNVYLELGEIGLFLLTMAMYFAYRNIKEELICNIDYGRFRMAIFFVVLAYNLTEDAVGKMTLMWFMMLLIAVHIPQESRSISSFQAVNTERSSARKR